jgi:hypothetical protein
MSDFLKNNIEKLIELENEESKYKEHISNLKKEKDEVTSNIVTFMERNKITDKDIIFGNSKIKYAQTKVQEGITKKRIQDRLTLFLKNENIAKEATDFIYSERDAKYNKSIKITNNK